MLRNTHRVSCNSCDSCNGAPCVNPGYKKKATRKFRDDWGESIESKMPWGVPSLGAASGQRMDEDSDEDDDDTPPPGQLPPAQGAAGAGKRKADQPRGDRAEGDRPDRAAGSAEVD